MNEYITEAFVLEKAPLGEIDSIVTLYTRALGKVRAKVKSGRKLVSKLNPHLEPGGDVMVRLLEKGSFQVVDALERRRGTLSLSFLDFVNRVVLGTDPDPALWHLLEEGKENRHAVMKILGLDPSLAVCAACGKQPVAAMTESDHEFFCRSCISQHSGDGVLYL